MSAINSAVPTAAIAALHATEIWRSTTMSAPEAKCCDQSASCCFCSPVHVIRPGLFWKARAQFLSSGWQMRGGETIMSWDYKWRMVTWFYKVINKCTVQLNRSAVDYKLSCNVVCVCNTKTMVHSLLKHIFGLEKNNKN